MAFGWDDLLGQVSATALGSLGQSSTNSANASINSAQQAFNADEAAKNRGFQHDEAQQQMLFQSAQRGTQYQTAVSDLKAAGLNPMLAYTNGGAGNTAGAAGSGSAASSGGMIAMGNKTQAGINNALSVAQLNNVNAQTDKTKAEERNIESQTPGHVAKVGETIANTQNLTSINERIQEDIKNVRMDTLSKEEQITLTRAQQQLTNINKELAHKNITNVEAQTALTRVTKLLKDLELPGANNLADYEKLLSTGGGNANKAIGALSNSALTIRKVLGK
jgi:hypothetical protein